MISCSLTWTTATLPVAGPAVVLVHQADDPGHGDRVADHGGLGHAGRHRHRLEDTFSLVRLQVVAEHRVGVAGLDPEDAGQGLDDLQIVQAQEALHDGGDVAGVADGHHHDLAGEIVVEPLGDLVGVGLLAPDAPGVLGVEQGHLVVIRQGLHHLHAVVEDPGDLQDPGAAAQGLGQLLRGDLAVGQEHRRGHLVAQVGGVEGRGGGGVAGGGADGQHLAGPGLAHQVVEVAQGRGHAPVLEGGAGVLAVVFEIKGRRPLLPGRASLAATWGVWPSPR